MVEHLTREQISRLLDEPDWIPGGVEHISECSVCANEYERMSRMRMALSALPELEPPASEWARIEQRVIGGHAGVVRVWMGRFARPLQVAAVVLLFAAGLAVGTRLGPAGGQVQEAAAPALMGGEATPGEAYLRTVAELQALQTGASQLPAAAENDPAAVAERITRLDALIEASREALRTAPADPVLNNFLFQLVDERERLAGRMDETLRLTAAEY